MNHQPQPPGHGTRPAPRPPAMNLTSREIVGAYAHPNYPSQSSQFSTVPNFVPDPALANAHDALWPTPEMEMQHSLPTLDHGIPEMAASVLWDSSYSLEGNYPTSSFHTMPVHYSTFPRFPQQQPITINQPTSYHPQIPISTPRELSANIGHPAEPLLVAPLVPIYKATGNANFLENAQILNYGTISNNVNQAPNYNVLTLLERHICTEAMFNGDNRLDVPKCHPGTRKSIIADIEPWAIRLDSGSGILWLKGPAGTGKSAISRSICEDLYRLDARLLAGSFFFCRNDDNRKSLNAFIPTIAYRLSIAIPEVGAWINLALSRDPAVLKYSLEDQWRTLIIEPLYQAAVDTNFAYRSLIVIDGLDECEPPSSQQRILHLLSDFQRYHLHQRIAVLITSRPEAHIQHEITALVRDSAAQFRQPDLELTDTPESRADMRIILTTTFDRIRGCHPSLMRDHQWLPPGIIDSIIAIAGGQFLYLLTIVRWLQEEGANPVQRLANLLYAYRNIAGSIKEPAMFVPLDHLYNTILQSARAYPDERVRELVLPCLYLILHKFTYDSQPTDEGVSLNHICDIAEILGEDTSVIRLALQHLHSVLKVPDSDKGAVKVYHTSFAEYLRDGSRSGTHFVEHHTVIVRLLIRALTPELAFSASPDIMQLWLLLPVRTIWSMPPALLNGLFQLNVVTWLREHHLTRIQSSLASWGTEYGDQYYWPLYQRQYAIFYRWLVTFLPEQHQYILPKYPFPPDLFNRNTISGYMSISSWIRDFKFGLLSPRQTTWMLFVLFFRSLYQGPTMSFSGFDDLAKRCIQYSCLMTEKHTVSCMVKMSMLREKHWLIEVIDALAIADGPGDSFKTLCEVIEAFTPYSPD